MDPRNNTEIDSSGNKPEEKFFLLRKNWRRAENVLFGIVLFFVSIYFVLQSPAVQNWLVRRVIEQASVALNTKVDLRRIDIEFFDNILLEDFFIEDARGDTLIYVKKLGVGMKSNFFTLLGQEIEIDQIELTGARIYSRRIEGDTMNTIRTFLSRIPQKQGSGKSAAIKLRIQHLNLTDVVYLSDTEVNNSRDPQVIDRERQYFHIPSGQLKIQSIDTENQFVDIQTARFDGLYIDLESYERPARLPFRPRAPKPVKSDKPRVPMTFLVGDLSLRNGKFQFDQFFNVRMTALPAEVMDYDHLDITDIALDGTDFEFNDEFNNNDFLLSGTIRHLAASERCGFQLKHAEAASIQISDTLASLSGTRIQTASSSLGDNIQLRYSGYRDIRNFVDSVSMYIRLSPGSSIQLGDISHFDRHVAENEFFQLNHGEVADIEGIIQGKIDRLRGDSLKLALGSTARIEGSMKASNLNQESSSPVILAFDLKEFRTDLGTVQRIIPSFKPPGQLFRLGSISFKGEYQLYDWVDHVIYGELGSDLGGGSIDLRMNLKDGPEKAVYGGELNMKQFNLAGWTLDDRFGNATFDIQVDDQSTGLSLATIRTAIKGKIDTLTFNGYKYRGVSLNGKFDQKVFDGALVSDDPNFQFTFDGLVNLKNEIPEFDFKSRITRIDLAKLNLTEKDLTISGDVKYLQLKGSNFEKLTGRAEFSNMKLNQDYDATIHNVGSVKIETSYRSDGSRYFVVASDILKVEMSGSYNLETVFPNLLKQLTANHGGFFRQLGVNTGQTDRLVTAERYELKLEVRDSRSLTKLISPDLDTLRDMYLRMNVEADKGLAYINLQLPEIRYGSMSLQDPNITVSTLEDSLFYSLSVPTILFSGERSVPQVQLSGILVLDELFFKLEAKGRQDDELTSSYIESLLLNGDLTVVDSLWQLRFNSSMIKILRQEWLIADDNYVRFNNNYFETREFELFSGVKRILLEGLNEGRGARFSLTNFNLNELNRLFDPEMIRLNGKIYDFEVRIGDIFKQENIEIGFLTDTMYINEHPYGMLLGNIDMADMNSPLQAKVFLRQNDSTRMRVALAWTPADGKYSYSAAVDQRVKPGNMIGKADFKNFPFEIIETFVPEISLTSGRVEGNLTLSGTPSKIGLDGSITVNEGQTRLEYLKAMFHIRNQVIRLTPNSIEAKKDTIWDASLKHFAFVDATLQHTNFADWSVDCSIKSADNQFLMMNTTAKDSDLYYGQGIGSFTCDISGTFELTNMHITAVTGKDTRLFLPLSTVSDASEVNFITFTNDTAEDSKTDANKVVKSFSVNDLKGLNFDLDLTINPEAEVQLIFDEQAGDIIRSKGRGDLTFKYGVEGNFIMYGRYTVEEGSYLFTLLNVVNKPFKMVKGGTIDWFGDPYNAKINLDATYEVNTPPYNFVLDEVELLSTLKNEASIATNVVVNMHLNGELMKPDITFDMSFPNVTSQLKSLTDNRLRILKQDQSEMSRQVFGLVVVGSFLPPNTGFIQAGNYASSLYNTVTQMIANQFSNYLAGVASEWFKGNISSLDLDIAYNDYQNAVNPGNQAATAGGREVQFRLKSGFKDDRITVQVGSQFGVGRSNLPVANGFLGEDVTVEIRITEDNHWKFKIYQRLEPDISGQRRDRYGVGLSFQKEYDSFSSMIQGIGKDMRRRDESR
ncbi:MAG: translocation/assembly module TamB [Saprospiraceae bacterium]|nr:translocation/assembly module TamB [Saprospiraceae bacterium]